MPHTLQAFLVKETAKSADELIEAFKRLPADKVAVSPGGNARSAVDQLAECALLNGATADMLVAKAWTMGNDFGPYMEAKAKLAQDADACITVLKENTAKAVSVIEGLTDEDLELMVEMPWESNSIAQVAAYPYWNMKYHQGQINYLAMTLGVLD